MTLGIYTKEASTALSIYLKNTATRAAAKEHKLENSVAKFPQHATNAIEHDAPHVSDSD